MCLKNISYLDYLLVRFDCDLGYMVGQYLFNDKNKNENIVLLNSSTNINNGIIENPSFNTIINIKDDDVIMIGKDNIIKFLNNQLQEITNDIKLINNSLESLHERIQQSISIYNKNKEKINITDKNLIKNYKTMVYLLQYLRKNIQNDDRKPYIYLINSMLYYIRGIYMSYKGIRRRNKFQKRTLYNIIDNLNEYIENSSNNYDRSVQIFKNNQKLSEINNILHFLEK